MNIVLSWLDTEEFFEKGFLAWLFTVRAGKNSLQASLGGDKKKLLVLAGNSGKPSIEARKSLSNESQTAVLVLSDEELKHEFHPLLRRRIVLRNYFQPRWVSRNVYTLPLGYNSEVVGLRKKRVPRINRPSAWSFVGEIKQEREEILDLFREVKPNSFFAAQKFNDPQGLRGKALFDSYASSYFVLCPFGNRSPDSFRVMEALEAGAIPVTISFLGTDHNRLIFGDHPFIVGKDWQDARELVRKLLADPVALKAKQVETAEWYEGYLDGLKSDLGKIFLGSPRSSLVSSQFRYQRRATCNPLIHLKYFSHCRRSSKSRPVLLFEK